MSDLVHLIKTNQDNNHTNNLYYFDFECDKWLKCYSLNSYPYKLYQYQLEESDKTFITCIDSYRFTEDLDNVPSIEEMYKEKEWRDEIAKNEQELDMYQNEEWHKMKVGWTKRDIIPDVLHLVPRKKTSANNHLCCYYYKESKKLAKSCTHTPIISIEELNKEKELEEKAKIYFENQKKQISEIVKTLTLYKLKKSDYYFYDTLTYFNTLKLYKEDKLLEKELFMNKEGYQDYLSSNNYKKGLASLAYHNQKNNYDIVSIKDELEVTNLSVKFEKYDAFYNIKIHNATYAKLNLFNLEIDADIIDNVNDNKKTFGFNDITENNPLFINYSFSTIKIITDGDKITFNGMILETLPRKIMLYSQNHIPIYFYKKNIILFLSSSFYSPEKIEYDRIEKTTNPLYKLNIQ